VATTDFLILGTHFLHLFLSVVGAAAEGEVGVQMNLLVKYNKK
jgi:hypothetical protein